MRVRLNLDIISWRKWTCVPLHWQPFVLLLTYLTSLTFASFTNYMPTLVASYFLLTDLFFAYPAAINAVDLLHFEVSQLFQCQFMLYTRTWTFYMLLLLFLYFNTNLWCILNRPKWRLSKLLFVLILLVLPRWLDSLQINFISIGLFFITVWWKDAFSFSYAEKIIVFLEFFQDLDFLLCLF